MSEARSQNNYEDAPVNKLDEAGSATHQFGFDGTVDAADQADCAGSTEQWLPTESALQPQEKVYSRQHESETQPNQLASENSSSPETMLQAAQQIIEDVNSKRTEDTRIVEDYKKALQLHNEKTFSLLEQYIFDMYEKQGKGMQERLQELSCVLDNIRILEQELHSSKSALGSLYQDMSKTG